jgi:purine-cytosine permease-like protein
LALLGVLRREMRAALIAGIIVFSAAAHLASPIAPALARIMEVGLGAIVAALVSIALGAVFRSPETKEPR